MTYTEDEAREKWCPFARGAIEPVCVASNCMAWRWANPKSEPHGSKPKGFCGLAGRPANED